MIVEILGNSCENIPSPAARAATVFLKLLDHHYASQFRQDNGIIPWTKDIEDAYLEFVHSSRAEGSLQKLRHDKDFKETTEENWDAAENEAFLAHELMGLFTAETTTYAKLYNHQKDLIPGLFAINITSLGADSVAHMSAELYQTKGVLLEYLPAFGLSALEKHATRSCWQNMEGKLHVGILCLAQIALHSCNGSTADLSRRF